MAPPVSNRTCSAPGCDRKHVARGFCARHYYAYRRETEPGYRDRLAATMRAARAADPSRFRAQRIALYAAHPERYRQSSRTYRLAHPERVSAALAAYRAANPERFAEHERARRAMLLSLFAEKVDPAAIWERDAGLCHLCGLPADRSDWHLDHVIPLNVGGPHCPDNVAASHPQCNQSKSNRLTPEMLASPRYPAALAAYDRFHGIVP